jgi:hypothetical protein
MSNILELPLHLGVAVVHRKAILGYETWGELRPKVGVRLPGDAGLGNGVGQWWWVEIEGEGKGAH